MSFLHSNIDLKKANIDEYDSKLKSLTEMFNYYSEIVGDNLGIWYEFMLKMPSDIQPEIELDTLESMKCCNHLISEIALTQEAYELAKADPMN